MTTKQDSTDPGSFGDVPSRVESTRGRGAPSLAERAAAELGEAYPERVSSRTRRELLALIERSCTRARGYGFEDEAHIVKFLHCVILLDNELVKATNPDVAYVLETLTMPNKPADRRIERAFNIARKVAARAPGSTRVPVSPPTPPPSRPPEPDRVLVSPQPSAPAATPPISRRPAASTIDESVQTTRGEPPPAIETWRPKESDEFPDMEGFRILEKLASGGMGTVYRAQDLRLDIEVAIKVLQSMHPTAQQQFLIEARAAAKLQHPNIIPVLRYEQCGQGGYCVMQLIKGRDAHQLVSLFGEAAAHDAGADRLVELSGLERGMINQELRGILRGPKPYYRVVAYWLAGVADGLGRAHGEGIIHYDVKPSNMILSPDGRMMLGDFGLATLAGQNVTQNSKCVGTPSYLSPEMVAAWASRAGTSATDLRVDIWGLGCTLYEALAYTPVYDGTLPEVLRGIATRDPVPPRDAMWHTPPELERICLKALARDPDDRYAAAGEMADSLRDFIAGRVTPGSEPPKGKWFGRKSKKG